MTAAVTRPPFADASPADPRGAHPRGTALIRREYRQALDVAAETFSLDELDKTLASWRRIAWMCTDSDRYRRMWRRAAELYTREEVPPEEELPITKARLGY